MESEYKTLKEWYEFNKPYLPAGYYIEIVLYRTIITKPCLDFMGPIFTIDILNYDDRMDFIVKTFGSWIVGKIQSDLTKTKMFMIDPANMQDYEKKEEGD